MSDYTSAFTAPFQIVENRNKRTDKSPTHSIVFNFTREDVCTIWNKDTKSADEFPGFAMWASCWNKSGRLSPPAVESSKGSKELPF